MAPDHHRSLWLAGDSNLNLGTAYLHREGTPHWEMNGEQKTAGEPGKN
jgi:hypothetical protein